MEVLTTEFGILIPFLTFVAVLCLGSAFISGSIAYRNQLRARLQSASLTLPGAGGPTSQLKGFVSKVGKRVSGKDSAESKTLRNELAQAGFNGRNAPALYMGTKILLLACGLVALGMVAVAIEAEIQVKAFVAFGGSTALFFLPNIFVRSRASQRTTRIRQHLPDAIDLLEICVSGGMGIDQAWNSVADQIRPVCPLLADEMALTNLEIHLGAERAKAMRHMADRTGSEELLSLVAVLVQSERFGTSVGDALRVFTTTMRETRSQRAEETAEKMAVKMLFPMVVLIFPVVIIVAVGPAGITIVDIFKN